MPSIAFLTFLLTCTFIFFTLFVGSNSFLKNVPVSATTSPSLELVRIIFENLLLFFKIFSTTKDHTKHMVPASYHNKTLFIPIYYSSIVMQVFGLFNTVESVPGTNHNKAAQKSHYFNSYFNSYLYIHARSTWL